jgi:hypothetical protein
MNMRHPRLFIAAAVAVTLVSREVGADVWHLKSASTVKTEKGSDLSLPPGYFLDELTWRERDLELKRLQDQETRLVAENESLRSSASSPVWLTVLIGAAGTALGITVAILK